MQELSPGDVINGRYKVERILGQGGMATVFRVRHEELGSRHALKLLDIQGKSVRKRLLQEGRIQASLAHPHIVAVTDVLDVDGSPGLVMEFVDGPTLTDVLAEAPPSRTVAEQWFRQIAQAVGYAHQRGLVHRDLKPDNVLMAKLDDAMHPKVADFGIAKVLGDTGANRPGTKAGMAMGTPAYMPPEQVNNAADADQRADVFALGCILYELMCHRQAFDAENMLSVFTAVLKGDYTHPLEVVPDLEPRIVTAIERALDPERSTRTRSVYEFLAILDSRLVPVDAPLPRAPRPPEAHGDPFPWMVAGSVLVVVLVVGLAGTVSFFGGLYAGWATGLFTNPEPETRLTFSGGGELTGVELGDLEPPDEELRASVPEVQLGPTLAPRVVSWHRAKRLVEFPFDFTPENGVYVVAEVAVENLTDEAQDIDDVFTLVVEGTSYDVGIQCGMALGDDLFDADELAARASASGTVCFDAPADLDGARIRFQSTGPDAGIEWFPL